MGDDFDVEAAVDEIGSDLGFKDDTPATDDVELEVTIPEKAEATETPAAAAEPEAKAEDPAPTEPTAPTDSLDEAPKTWRKEASAVWASLPSEAKSEILKREQDIWKGIEQYKESATYGNNFRQAITQFEPILRANGMDPIQTAASLFRAHHELATSAPERKLELFRTLAKDYNIDIAEAALYEAPYVDPAVAGLQQQLSLVQSRLADADRQTREAAAATAAREVQEFAAKNAYFDEVADQVAMLLKSNSATTLQDAYDKAVWLNPSTRAKEIARQTAATTSKAQVKVASVKQATAANVKTRGKSGSTAAPTGTLEDTLESSLAEIRSRA